MQSFKWDIDLNSAGRETQRAVRTVKFGDGYEQRSNEGIAPALSKWSASKTASKAVCDEVEAFLLAHTATPFYWRVDGIEGLYVLDEGSLRRSYHGKGYCTVSFTLREVRA